LKALVTLMSVLTETRNTESFMLNRQETIDGEYEDESEGGGDEESLSSPPVIKPFVKSNPFRDAAIKNGTQRSLRKQINTQRLGPSDLKKKMGGPEP